MYDIILASNSPRRQSLFSLITNDFRVIIKSADESGYNHLPVEQRVVKLAEIKCLAVAEDNPDSVVIGSDTLVELSGEVFGKPMDSADASRTLKVLSGNTHNVYTGVYISLPGERFGFSCLTEVTFRDMDVSEISGYIASGEPFDKAGSYGIQGIAARYIEHIKGDYFNVLGLPVSRLYSELKCRDIV